MKKDFRFFYADRGRRPGNRNTPHFLTLKGWYHSGDGSADEMISPLQGGWCRGGIGFPRISVDGHLKITVFGHLKLRKKCKSDTPIKNYQNLF